MRATRINHVSVHAQDMETSVGFYEDLFGATQLPTPNFGFPVQWLSLGEQQLHLFVLETEAPSFHHLSFDVDDFGAVYRRARELGILDASTNGQAIRKHPMGWVQLYIRDPAGNLLEINWPDAESLDDDVRADILGLDELGLAQEGASRQATLYHAQTREASPTSS